MALNYIWVAFFLIAFVVALFKLIFLGDTEIFKIIVEGMFDSSKMAVMDIALPLAGVMTFFLGILKVGEEAGVIRRMAKIISPFFSKLFPEVPKDHPANGQMIMNFSANMLGLDNAATPFGLSAMQSLQTLNPSKDTASNAQIMFMVLHSAGPVLIPLSIMAQRAIYNAADPADIFIPALISVYVATLTGMLFVGIKQRINFFDKTLLSWLLGLTGFIGFVLWYFARLPKEEIEATSKVVSNMTLMVFIVGFIGGAVYKKVNIFPVFIEGAKTGFETSLKVLPYLVGLLVAIGAFRNSGALTYIVDGLKWAFSLTGMNTDFTDALPTALMHPLSGSGSRAMMIDSMKTFGADSFVGRLACVFQACSDTILYVFGFIFWFSKHQKYSLYVGGRAFGRFGWRNYGNYCFLYFLLLRKVAKVLRGKGTKQPIKIYKIFIINTLPTVQNQLQIYILCTFATLYLCTFDTFTFKTKKMTGTFEELIASEKPILIDFFATWCGPCKALTPTLQQLAQEEGEKIRIVKIDVDQNPKLAAKYRVTGVPTLILFQNSELKWRQSGVLSLPQLKDVVKKFA